MNRHVFPVLVRLHDNLSDDPLVSMYVPSLHCVSICLRDVNITGLWHLLLVERTGSVWERQFGSRRCGGCRAWTAVGDKDGLASTFVAKVSF